MSKKKGKKRGKWLMQDYLDCCASGGPKMTMKERAKALDYLANSLYWEVQRLAQLQRTPLEKPYGGRN